MKLKNNTELIITERLINSTVRHILVVTLNKSNLKMNIKLVMKLHYENCQTINNHFEKLEIISI